MNVGELIQLLNDYPADLRVMVDGYEDGYDDLEPGCVRVREMRLNVNKKWYYGRHEVAYPDNRDKGSGGARALVLERPAHDDDE